MESMKTKNKKKCSKTDSKSARKKVRKYKVNENFTEDDSQGQETLVPRARPATGMDWEGERTERLSKEAYLAMQLARVGILAPHPDSAILKLTFITQAECNNIFVQGQCYEIFDHWFLAFNQPSL
jgi:hypothetical protein